MTVSDDEHLRIIVRLCDELSAYLAERGATVEDICSDHVLQWTVTTPLYNIGENVYRLSDELKEHYPEVPWFRIAGMRHRLVHDYEGTNWKVVAEAALVDVPEFAGQVRSILRSRGM